MRVLILSGPNLGTLGRRQPEIYGTTSLPEIHAEIGRSAERLGVEVRCEQSNHEGTLIDLIEEETGRADALVINPGGLAHTSIALADAVRGFDGVVIEVHLSNIAARERFRHHSHVAAAATATITGLGASGYVLAVEAAVRRLRSETEETR